MTGLFFILLLVLEVGVLFYLERIAWHTLYTPLTCLMMPYLLVQVVTLLIAGHFGFVSFYYPSIYVWSIGLVVFALPSYVLSIATTKYVSTFCRPVSSSSYPLSLGIISVGLIIAFFLRLLYTLKTSNYLLGTEDFADDFCGHGLWAHLRCAIIPLLIVAIYHVRKRSYLLWCVVLALLAIQLIYLVKGAVIITVVSGLFIRLYAGKMNLSLSLLLKLVIGALALFLATYMVLPLLGSNGDANLELVKFVMGHFVHYLTSGTLGYSYDLQINCPDTGSFETLVSPFINIYRQFTGNDQMLSAVNPYYLYTGLSWTNVRTFFGTMYIYCNTWQFVAYTLTASTLMYAIKLVAMGTGNLYVYAILCYYCGLMAMGWFEFYLFHLAAFEVPVVCLLLMVIEKVEIYFKAKIK